jgi:pyruvate formate lyase activating enzyme
MRLGGLQKMTLLDFPGHVACTVFTVGCNFRCPFCHNSSLVVSPEVPELSQDDFFAFLQKRRGLLDGVAITGGEPLLHPDMPTFLRRIRDLGYAVKLDTNGSFPDRLIALVEEGLVDRVAVDIKNSPALYAKTVGVPGFDLAPVERSKNYLLSGKVEYEFRTTVVRGFHTEESLLEAADWIQGARVWYLQQFQDSGALIQGEGLSAFSNEEMQHLLTILQKKLPAVKLRGI